MQIRGFASQTNRSPRFCILLSKDGGATWTAADFGANFRVRIVDTVNSTFRTFSLGGVAVQVTYQ